MQQRLREETSHLPDAGMQIGADQGALLAMLVRLLGARRAIEIRNLHRATARWPSRRRCPPAASSCVATSAKNGPASAVATGRRQGWPIASSSKLAPATETLAALIRNGGAGTFDFAFIDADKTSYDAYYESCLMLLRAGGLIALDNMLWSGRVADPQFHDARHRRATSA